MTILRLERHRLGPRLHVLGVRIHEYHAGVAIAAGAPLGGTPIFTAAIALVGAFLVVKDWPDLFPATRDQASWRLGIHRLPPKAS